MKEKLEINWYWFISHIVVVLLAIISIFLTPKEYDIPIAIGIVSYQVIYWTLVLSGLTKPLIDEK